MKIPQVDNKYDAYIYPIINRRKSGTYNPYIDNFINSTSGKINYLNKDIPSNTGILNLFKFISRIDLLILNWIEDLPDKRWGFFQSIIFLITLRIMKYSRIKIIWIIHNKFSHSPDYIYFKKLLFFDLLKKSDLIITHSLEGINFAEKLSKGITEKIFFFQHPITPFKEYYRNNVEKKFDILIWGTLAPYKAIDIFLEFLSDNNVISKFNILIAGKAVTKEYFQQIKKYENENIIIKNQFIESATLASMIQQSKVILFTYSGDSVLSSGALIDSIAYGATVIGPNVGAFAELGDIGIIKTYDRFEDLLILLEQIDKFNNRVISKKISDFINAYSWPEFNIAFQEKVRSLYM